MNPLHIAYAAGFAVLAVVVWDIAWRRTASRWLCLKTIWVLMGLMRFLPAESISYRRHDQPFLGHATCRECGEGWSIFIPDGSDVHPNATLCCPSCEEQAGRFD